MISAKNKGLRVIKKKYRLEYRGTKFLSWISDKYTCIFEKHTYHSCIYWPAIYIYCNRLYGLHDFTGFTLSRVTQEYDFSINNAPLIIALLFKGEWQSFPCSRGERGLCVSGKGLIYILESAPYSQGVCLSFSANTDSELALLWKTLQSFAHRLHYRYLVYFLLHLCCPSPQENDLYAILLMYY